MMYDAPRKLVVLKTTRTGGTNLEFALGPHLSPGSIRTPIFERDYDWIYARTQWRPWPEVRRALQTVDRERELAARRVYGRRIPVPVALAVDLARRRGPVLTAGSPVISHQYHHMTAAEVRGVIGSEAFEEASKLAVVRHPYETAVSHYYMATTPGAPFAGWRFAEWFPANTHVVTWNRDIVMIGDRPVVDRLIRHEDLPDALSPHLADLGIDVDAVMGRFTANRKHGHNRPKDGPPAAELIDADSRRLIDELCWFEFDVLGYQRGPGSARLAPQRVHTGRQAGFDRNRMITAGLPLDRPGIEIAPLYRPIVPKKVASVLYVDVCAADESRAKHAGYEHDPIVDVDVVWEPGRRLLDCISDGTRFSWGVASHVLEHVPDPIGWLRQVLETMEDGAVLSLALPDKHHCFDRFRADTTAAELIDAWVRGQVTPSPRQVFDFVAGTVSSGYIGHDGDVLGRDRFEDCDRHYTDQQALDFVVHTWRTGDYLDVHCSVFSPETVVGLFEQLAALGVLAVSVSDPVRAGSEFLVRLTRTGSPTCPHPGAPHPRSLGAASDPDRPMEGAPPARAQGGGAPVPRSGSLGAAARWILRRAGR